MRCAAGLRGLGACGRAPRRLPSQQVDVVRPARRRVGVLLVAGGQHWGRDRGEARDEEVGGRGHPVDT
eukprot:scaffold121042_cov17-Tisochrysis_lutea.AAC.1